MPRPTGTTTWIDLSTTDRAAVTAFYSALFGWVFEDLGEEMNHYSLVRNRDGSLVGGMMDVTGMTCPEGDPLPSEWGVFLAVDDVDARVAKAVAAGATQLFPSADVLGAGRFAVLLDSTRQLISLWQAGGIDGYEFTGATGSPVWFELMSHDVEKAKRFYTEVLDADLVPMGGSAESARYFTNGSQDKATWGLCDATGVMDAEDGGWRVYFAVDSCDPAVERIRELGGRLVAGPDDSPFGRIATVADPAGATFQICAMSEAVREGEAEREG